MPKDTMEHIYPLTIYYDSRCPLCSAEMGNLQLRNTADGLCPLPPSGEGRP